MGTVKLGAVLCGLLTGVAPTFAEPIIDFTGGMVDSVSADVTYGYDFAVTHSFTVTGLGVFESFTQALASSHAVGLWDDKGELLATSVVSGTGDTEPSISALGHWRIVKIAPVKLEIGRYFVGVSYLVGSAEVLLDATPVSLEDVSYGTARYQFGNSLMFPTNTFASSLVGPVVLVPEPAILLLLSTGLGVATIRVSRRR